MIDTGKSIVPFLVVLAGFLLQSAGGARAEQQQADSVSIPTHKHLPPRYSPGARKKIEEMRENIRRKGQANMILSELNPQAIWKHFERISAIPRCSGHEGKLAEYITSFAASQGLAAQRDSAGNVFISIPATAGREKSPGIILQTHLDMVCEKNADVEHDFNTQPLDLEAHGDWLSARGTTLGADDGIGVATALAVAETRQIVHGPIELLFTVEEEIGLIGANKLESRFVKGSMLINLDSEELGAIYVGCAGGSRTDIFLPVTWKSQAIPGRYIEISVGGLQGGHSGMDIDKKRGSAIKLLARILTQLEQQNTWSLSNIQGGNKSNAIPREASAVIWVTDNEDHVRLMGAAEQERAAIYSQWHQAEPGLEIGIKDTQVATARVLEQKSSYALIGLLDSLPHGVEAMSKEIQGLVETSNNLARVMLDQDTAMIECMSRSSVAKEQKGLEQRIADIAIRSGATSEIRESYPGWEPDMKSKLLSIATASYSRELGKNPEVKAVHAGLECGIIGEKIPGLQMISIGPTIEGAHSPGERLNIPSVAIFWNVLTDILKYAREGSP